MLPARVIVVPTGPAFGEIARVSGVTVNAAEARKVELDATSTKYPPPITCGTVIVVPPGMAPPAVVSTDFETPVILQEKVFVAKQRT